MRQIKASVKYLLSTHSVQHCSDPENLSAKRNWSWFSPWGKDCVLLGRSRQSRKQRQQDYRMWCALGSEQEGKSVKVKDGGAECLGQQGILSRILQIRLPSELKPEGSGVCQALGGRAFPNETSDEKVQRTSAWQVQEWGQGRGTGSGCMRPRETQSRANRLGQGGPGGYTDYTDQPSGTRGVQTGAHHLPPVLDLPEVWLLHNMWRWLYRPTACLDGTVT